MSFPVDGTIPGAGDLLSKSQKDIQTNFSNIVGWGAIDHLGYGTNGAGTHKQITFNATLAAPAPAGSVSLVTPQSVTYPGPTTISELFFTNATKNIQITNSTLTASSGKGMLPGGLQIQCGSASVPAGSPGSTTVTTTFPTQILIGVASSVNANVITQVFTGFPNVFQIKGDSAGGYTANWIAIGY